MRTHFLGPVVSTIERFYCTCIPCISVHVLIIIMHVMHRCVIKLEWSMLCMRECVHVRVHARRTHADISFTLHTLHMHCCSILLLCVCVCVCVCA